MKTSDYKSFAYLENGDIVFSEFETIKAVTKLDAGIYTLDYLGYPKNKVILKQSFDFEIARMHNFSDKEKIDNLFDSFFNEETRVKIEKLGFCHKIGILFYGLEGTGKTSIIKYYCNHAVTVHDAIVFYIMYKREEIKECWEFIQNIRKIQNNPIIIVFDEFDQQMRENEAFLKTVIDGNMSISNCIFLAATNYLDQIPKAMIARPSRFKYCLNIEGIQGVEDIVNIISPILGDVSSKEELVSIANGLKGSTLDCIKQYCFDRLMAIKYYENNKKQIGFK